MRVLITGAANAMVQKYINTFERAGLERRDLDLLASAGALQAIAGHRHRARWQVSGVEKPSPLFESMQRYEAAPLLVKPSEGQDIVADYQVTGLSLERHPLALLRDRLARYRYRAMGACRARPRPDESLRRGQSAADAKWSGRW